MNNANTDMLKSPSLMPKRRSDFKAVRSVQKMGHLVAMPAK